MRIAVLGTGMVGRALASKLDELGHEVTMGSRSGGGDAATGWVREASESASEGSFADAAARGEVVVNATSGVGSLPALEAAGADNLEGKVLIDVANPIEPRSGMPPMLAFCNTESLGERIQAAFPTARVVKALNTVNAGIMVDPGAIAEPTDVFVCGNDPGAKSTVAELLASFGWERDRVRDLGGIDSARGTEMYLAFWLRAMGMLGSARFNVRLVAAG